MPRADDGARDAGLIEHPPDGNPVDPDAPRVAITAERGEKILETIPSAELVDDQADT